MRPDVRRWWTPPSETTLWHKLVVAVPMGLLHIVDSTIMVATLGFVQPSLSLDWGFIAHKWSGPPARYYREQDAIRDDD